MNASAHPIIIIAPPKTPMADAKDSGPQLGWVNAVLLYGLFALLAFAVLALGGAEPWPIFIFEAGSVLLFVIWAIKQLAYPKLSLPWSPLYPAFAIVATVVLMQLAVGLTVYSSATLQESLQYLAYLLLVIVANDCFRHRNLAHRFAFLLCLFGFALACVSLAQDAAHSSKLLFLRTPPEAGWSYGPYANHDHYAGLMLMLAAFPLPLAMAPYLRGRLRALLGTAAAIMVATIFLSGSRGGVIAFFAQAAFLALVFARGRQDRRKVAITGCLAFILLAALFASGKGVTFDRLAGSRRPLNSELTALQLNVLRDSSAMLRERPILGWGLGTFEDVYPQFRSFYTNQVVEHAHNDYLELLLETGMVGFAGVLWFVVALLRSGWKKLPRWKTDLTGTIKIGAMAGCVAMLVHSLMDSSLQITGNAALFYVLSALVAGSTEENQAA